MIGLGLSLSQVAVRQRVSGFALDALSVEAAAAYSTRRLRAGYTGAALRVRRSSDNVEANIGFTAAGALDTVALLAHCGSGNGFVTTWYDQSGNGRNAVQATAAAQPRIVSAGVVETINGRPTIRAHINSTLLSTWKFAAPSTNWSLAMVASRDNIGANANNVVGSDGNAFNANGMYPQIAATNVNVVFNRTGAAVQAFSPTITIAAGENVVFTTTHTTDNVATVALNGNVGSPTAPITWTAGAFSDFRLGPYPASPSVSLLGTYQEMISFGAALSTPDRQSLERNQGAAFGITVA